MTNIRSNMVPSSNRPVTGFGHYQDSDLTYGTPDQVILTGVRTQMTIDDLGVTVEKLPYDATEPFWHDNHIHPIATFDTYNLRLGFAAEGYSGADSQIVIELDIGGSLGVIWERTISLIKGGNEQFIAPAFPIYTGATFVANGGVIYLTYTGGNADCAIFKKQIFIDRLSREAT